MASYLALRRGFTVYEQVGDIPHGTSLWRSDIRVVVTHFEPQDSACTSLLKRPYCLLVHVDAPILARYDRAMKTGRISEDCTLYSFVSTHDSNMKHGPNSLSQLSRMARLHIMNDASSIDALFYQLRKVDFMDKELLRPGWDSYFMALAFLAAERTNCMKRRVGCVIARDKRVVATGYNGTPSGVTNCCDGGCLRCNGDVEQGVGLDLCLCLHAEENAIIEAGRDRCRGATLYTNLFPCVLCAKKIVQAGISRAVYSSKYATDTASQALLLAGGVKVESFDRDSVASVLGVLSLRSSP